MIGYEEANSVRAAIPPLRIIGGWLCLIAGVAGLVFPVLPGVPLLLTGLVLLSAHYRWARRCLHWLRERLRKLGRRYSKQDRTLPNSN
jgi:uncharacterized membrane protein YbaN (DUF454 family)